MKFMRVQNTDAGATFIDLEKVEAVAVKVRDIPGRPAGSAFDIEVMEMVATPSVPASQVVVVTLTCSGRDYTIHYESASPAHELLNQQLGISVPFEVFEK